MSSKRGWIGVDLDGTLAHYDHWRGVEHIGEPIHAMVDRVKCLLADGLEVRIFTARVAGTPAERKAALRPIQAWCLEHIGVKLLVTATKDRDMELLFDDRCRQVETNTGRIVEEVAF